MEGAIDLRVDTTLNSIHYILWYRSSFHKVEIKCPENFDGITYSHHFHPICSTSGF